MTQGQASPAVTSRGLKTERIVLTRVELIKLISRFLDEVKEAEDFSGWLDDIFAEAERDGLITFNAGDIPGRRFNG